LQLATIAFVIAVFICINFFTYSGRLEKEAVGFEAVHIIVGLLLLAAGFMASYLLMNRKGLNDDKMNSFPRGEKAKYNTNNIDTNNFKEYALTLGRVIDEKKLHLNPGFSLDDLSLETHIPKHHLSQLFNNYLG